MITNILRSAILVTALGAAPTYGHAAAVTFFGQDTGLGETSRLGATPESDRARASFIDEGGNGFVESFERFDDGSYPYRTPDGAWNPGHKLRFSDAGGRSGTPPTADLVTTRGSVVHQPTGTNGFGRYPTHGDKFFHSGADEISFVFDRKIHGFGFDGIDIGDYSGKLTVDIYDGQKLLQAFTLEDVVGGNGGDVLFWGFLDQQNPFDTVVFGNTNGDGDVFAMDGITVVTPVPAALPLLGSGLAALAWLRRRRSAA